MVNSRIRPAWKIAAHHFALQREIQYVRQQVSTVDFGDAVQRVSYQATDDLGQPMMLEVLLLADRNGKPKYLLGLFRR